MGAFAATRCPAREDGQAALAGAVTACQGFDLGRCGIVGEIEKSPANAVANDLVECLVLLAGTRGQLDLVSGHPRSALRNLGVHVGKRVGAPVIGIPLSECVLCDCQVGCVFERPNGSGPGGGDAGGHDSGDPSALQIGEVDHLPALGSVVGRVG
jgi:hypothetical protein